MRSIVADGYRAVADLVADGARFDESAPGQWALTREGGHSIRRIIHAGGDATGAEVQRALDHAAATLDIRRNHVALEILHDGTAVTGVLVRNADGLGVVHAPSVILATGGLGHLYSATTNPEGSTGDGIALALWAGVGVSDIEFIQFHPTMLFDRDAAGRRPLITEALRGEGAVLRDARGESVTDGVHPMGDLAPRDVVAAAIEARLRETGDECVYLDARSIDGSSSASRRSRRPAMPQASTRPAQAIPVVPGAHYSCGGVLTDVYGRTELAGLFAAGEVARTGMHGANRLASNSLLEGLVVGGRAGKIAAEHAGGAGGSDGQSRTCATGYARPPGSAERDDAVGLGGARRRRVGRLAEAARRGDPAPDEQPRRLRGRRAHRHRPGGRRGGARPHRDPRLPPPQRLLPDGSGAGLQSHGARRTRGRLPAMKLTDDERSEALITIRRGLDEDLRYGPDVTTLATVPEGATTVAALVTREPGVAAGVDVALLVLDEVLGADGYRVLDRVEDGTRLEPGAVLLRVEGPTRGLLTAERTLLNLVCHLSGIATATAAWVDAVEGTNAEIRDTRKTLPGLRALQKYAVRVGGGVNHRMGLGDAALIKDNHVAAAGSVVAALRAVRAAAPDLPCEVEVDTLEQLDEVLAEDVQLILLDNFPVWQTQIAVQRRDSRAPGVRLESSGGLSLDTAAEYAGTGVDYLAVGALTHSVRVLDVGLDL